MVWLLLLCSYTDADHGLPPVHAAPGSLKVTAPVTRVCELPTMTSVMRRVILYFISLH